MSKFIDQKYSLIAIIAFLLIFSLTFMAINYKKKGEEKKDKEIITSIVYQYDDSSVPPKYHRSYKIDASNNKISIVVDSYGEVLAQEDFALTTEQFAELVAFVKEEKLKNSKMTESMGCTGGTGESVSFLSNEKDVFKGSVYHCGGKDYGNLKGEIDGFATKIKSFIPDFEKIRSVEYIIES